MLIPLFLLGKQEGNGIQYYSNKKIESRSVFNMPENHFVPIFIRFKGDFLAEFMFLEISRKL